MGKTFPVGDSNGLANALISLFDQPSQYEGDQIAIGQNFSSDSTAAAYEELYRKIESEL
jgi:hypothetical protein